MPAPSGPASDRPARYRRGPQRGGRGAGSSGIRPQAAQDPNGAIQPPRQDQGALNAADGHASDNRGHGRRGGFGRGRRGGGSIQHLAHAQRAFGGHLTSNPSVPPGLAADVFAPGRPIAPRSRPLPQHVRWKPKSQAPDIATRTHEDITNGHYECVICTEDVLPNSEIWSCRTCWSCLHFSCVKKWSQNEISTHQQRATENGELPPPRQWRCAGCNLPQDKLPEAYTCWCSKEIEPRSIPGLPPHSCGQTCAKARVGKCPHPCDLICHAGPCPPCPHMGPSIACFCGKETTSRRCLDTNYDDGWSCGQICGDLLPCGEHYCQRSCHEGVCGSCNVQIDSCCYCGKVQMPLACADREEALPSEVIRQGSSSGETIEWTGSFNCEAPCGRAFDCGNPGHICRRTCHTQEVIPARCPYAPDVITHCPCGKTPLDSLLSEPRLNCTQPIPKCAKQCGKSLDCGHPCEAVCHEGGCRPCLQSSFISCCCGRTTSKTLCHQDAVDLPQCSRVCRATLNCGRHECGEHCCAGEKKAAERQSWKRKHRPLDAARSRNESVEAEHICLRTCSRALKCGNHSCADLCHKGPCRGCVEAVFEEISCACGRTVLTPPQPCGTTPPNCSFDCTRRRTCGHPQIKHDCHQDAEPCPKCPFLMEKRCICGKRSLKNQRCWLTEVRCGLPCGKKLKCGIHHCQKVCHRSGDCEDVAKPCHQPCGRQKTICDHTCSDPCHAPYPCKETSPCQAKTLITCGCQIQKQPAKCLASKSSEGNSKKTLGCNDECLKLQRNAKLAAALNIDPATRLDDHIPYTQQTLDLFRDNATSAKSYEREVRAFAADENEKRLRFKPMPSSQRAFLHSLAEDFGFDSESQDPEPHRHVCIFKTPRFICAPMKTLGQCVAIKSALTEEPTPSAKAGVSRIEPFNALLLTNPRFGLMMNELRSDLASELSNAEIDFDILFIPAGDVVLRAQPVTEWRSNMEPILASLKPLISKKIRTLNLASGICLCMVDSDAHVLRKEDTQNGTGGWSHVVKGATPVKNTFHDGVGAKSSFMVLGTQAMKNMKKEAYAEEAVDDWEKEVEGWEYD